MICAVKGFMLENLAILHQFFTSNKNMAVVLALEMMMSSGLTRSDLSPFIWPSAHEEKYWDIVRSEMEGQAMWPNVDVVSRNDAVADVLRLICLLEAFHLMYTKPDGSYVMAVIASSSSQTLPEAAYCDEHSMFKVQTRLQHFAARLFEPRHCSMSEERTARGFQSIDGCNL